LIPTHGGRPSKHPATLASGLITKAALIPKTTLVSKTTGIAKAASTSKATTGIAEATQTTQPTQTTQSTHTTTCHLPMGLARNRDQPNAGPGDGCCSQHHSSDPGTSYRSEFAIHKHSPKEKGQYGF
jgi:hypothetical protein